MDAIFKTAGEREAGVTCSHCHAPVRLADEVAACPACGSVHHRACWAEHGGCGAYSCAPARRMIDNAEPKIRISTEDIQKATPPIPVRRGAYISGAYTLSPANGPATTSRLAIAALVFAILGIPLVGVLTGAVAVVLAGLAIAEISNRGRKGLGLALGGMALGLCDVVGWIVAMMFIFRGGPVGPHPTGQQISEADLKMLSAPIAQAMRANALITAGHGMGSGIIMRLENGQAQVLSNRHVVDGSFESANKANLDPSTLAPVSVQMLGQPIEQGQVVWLAPDNIDLAIVSVPCRGQTAAVAKWPTTRPTRIGDPIFAIGNPHAWGWTHTQGAVSQFRTLTLAGHEVSIIQTSVPINPGNSGGGLYDADGALIGVTTWTSDKRVSEGLNFAISLNALLKLAPQQLDRTIPPIPLEKDVRP